VEDTQGRAEIKMKRAVEEVKKLLVPAVSTCYTHTRIYIMDATLAAFGLMPSIFSVTQKYEGHSVVLI